MYIWRIGNDYVISWLVWTKSSTQWPTNLPSWIAVTLSHGFYTLYIPRNSIWLTRTRTDDEKCHWKVSLYTLYIPRNSIWLTRTRTDDEKCHFTHCITHCISHATLSDWHVHEQMMKSVTLHIVLHIVYPTQLYLTDTYMNRWWKVSLYLSGSSCPVLRRKLPHGLLLLPSARVPWCCQRQIP